MKKFFLVYGHYNDNSFNAAIRDTFVKTAEAKGNKVDLVDLYKEKFDPVFAGEDPDLLQQKQGQIFLYINLLSQPYCLLLQQF